MNSKKSINPGITIYQFVKSGSLMRHIGGSLRNCDDQGRIIPRIRMSKKLRLKLRRAALLAA